MFQYYSSFVDFIQICLVNDLLKYTVYLILLRHLKLKVLNVLSWYVFGILFFNQFLNLSLLFSNTHNITFQFSIILIANLYEHLVWFVLESLAKLGNIKYKYVTWKPCVLIRQHILELCRVSGTFYGNLLLGGVANFFEEWTLFTFGLMISSLLLSQHFSCCASLGFFMCLSIWVIFVELQTELFI